MAPPKI